MREKKIFNFKQFSIRHEHTAMKVGTDGVLLGAWTSVENAKRILDIGTGTGLLALMLAQRTKDATIDAIDIDQQAFEEASLNVRNSPWENRITVCHLAVQKYNAHSYDLIICNPPFFQNSLTPPDLKRELARHNLTLPIHELATHSKRLMSPYGSISIIVPFIDSVSVRAAFLREKLYCNRSTVIRTKATKSPERILMQFSLSSAFISSDEIILLDETRNRTVAYSNLTKDFYLTP